MGMYNDRQMYHYRKTRKKYDNFPRPKACAFCDYESIKETIVEEFDHCYVIPNRTFYDVWEMRNVTDHLLIIPKSHTESIGSLREAERHEVIEVIAKYESSGYNFYGRGPGNSQKSVPHQHTHLLKVDETPARGAVFIRKPYVLFKF